MNYNFPKRLMYVKDTTPVDVVDGTNLDRVLKSNKDTVFRVRFFLTKG